jgi:hypothetical protein
MSVDRLCVAIEDAFDAVNTTGTPQLNAVRVHHGDFSLVIEVTDEQVIIHLIEVYRTSQGIGGDIISCITEWALEEDAEVVALNVIPDAETWWVAQGFYRTDSNSSNLYYSSEESEETDIYQHLHEPMDGY